MTSNSDSIQPLSSPPTSNKTLPSIQSKSNYIFPSIYSFPPFFTQQPNPKTSLLQFNLWQTLILSYCKFHQIFKFQLNLNLILNLDLFNNSNIKRTADYESTPSFNTNPTNPTTLIIYFHPIRYWSNLIYDHILLNGLTNSILTFYELRSDEMMRMELRGLDEFILRKALNLLVKEGKAKIFKSSSDGISGETEGVKFF
ncbi:ESCRT-II complex subunit-domain-containing protein [Melampsora americana]|nr:ESCRT-II complex subunit-domain-containing protein [Melampsora americana]